MILGTSGKPDPENRPAEGRIAGTGLSPGLFRNVGFDTMRYPTTLLKIDKTAARGRSVSRTEVDDDKPGNRERRPLIARESRREVSVFEPSHSPGAAIGKLSDTDDSPYPRRGVLDAIEHFQTRYSSMKSLCNREGMSAAFASVGGVAPVRSPKPILQNLKFVVDSSGSTLMATDLELGIRYAVSGVRVDEPGAVILPTGRMQQLLRLSTEDDLAIESAAERVEVAGIRGKWHFAAEDPELFPEVPAFVAREYHVLNSADLRKLIRRTGFATDTESTRYALGGVLVEFGDDTISMVGTDGRRLARMTVPARKHGEVSMLEGLSPVIPVKALKLIERNLTDDDSPVHLAIYEGNSALIRTERAVIYSRLVEGRFPRYQDVFPSTHEYRIDLVAGELLRSVQQSMIVTSDESRGVDFRFGEGTLTLTSKSPVGDSRLSLPIDFDEKPVEITFDPRYLVEALQTLDEDARITVDLINSKTAALFHTEDRYDYIVMPLTREA